MTDEEKKQLVIDAKALFELWLVENEEGYQLSHAWQGQCRKDLERAFTYGFAVGVFNGKRRALNLN